MALHAIGAALFLLSAWAGIRHSCGLPYWDDWALVQTMLNLEDGQPLGSALWAQHNESRLVIPRLLCWICWKAWGWDTRLSVALIYAIIAGILIVWQVLFRRLVTSDPVAGGVMSLAGVLLVATPLQVENISLWVQIAYFIPPLCLSLALLGNSTGMPMLRKAVVNALLAAVAMSSISGGAVVWLLAFPWGGRTRRGAAWWLYALLGLVFLGLYFHGYTKPPYTIPLHMVVGHPIHAASYGLVWLGAPLADTETGASWGGRALLALGAGLVLARWRFRAESAGASCLPWIVWMGYSLALAALATAGRFMQGSWQALASRYLGYSCYFTLAVIALLLEPHLRGRSWRNMAVIALLLALGARWLDAPRALAGNRDCGRLIQNSMCGGVVFRKVLDPDPLLDHCFPNADWAHYLMDGMAARNKLPAPTAPASLAVELQQGTSTHPPVLGDPPRVSIVRFEVGETYDDMLDVAGRVHVPREARPPLYALVRVGARDGRRRWVMALKLAPEPRAPPADALRSAWRYAGRIRAKDMRNWPEPWAVDVVDRDWRIYRMTSGR